MPKPVHIKNALAGLPVLRGRRPDTPIEETAPSFTTLATTEDGGVFAGSFQGESPWERHPNGDEVVQILDGAAQLTILTDEGAKTLDMQAGMLTVVPKGNWHRFNAPDGVTVMTTTPQPTEHSTVDDPRQVTAAD